MSLWQELESLQKKQTELNKQLLSGVEREQNFLEMMANIMQEMQIQEEHIHKLEVRLNDEHEALSKLESRIAELEKILKKPVNEPAREEPEKQLMAPVPAVS